MGIEIRRVEAGGISRQKVGCVVETQEIPATFTTETGWPGDDNCALVTSITIEKEWPLRFRRFPDMRRGVSAVSVGEGWARFMSNQGLGLGALLTFEVVDERRLVVGIHRRSALTEQQAFQQLPNASLIACDARVTAQVDNNFPDHPPQPSLHEVRGDARPHFQKTLRKTHTKNCAASRLVSLLTNFFSFRQHFSMCREFLYIRFNYEREVNWIVLSGISS